MVEFGEQLRKARQAKGMTQQSLAEQLYVTRQAVSRWECGDRYPDLPTTKKISLILEVSLDDLLSGNEMKKAAERNPVIEKPLINHMVIVLYTFLALSLAVSVIDIILRFPLTSAAIDYSDIQVIGWNLLGLSIQIGILIYGLTHAAGGMLSPKCTGVVISVFFAAMCFTGSERISGSPARQMISVSVLLIVPGLLGAAASFLYFIKAGNWKPFPVLIVIAALWEIIRTVISLCETVQDTGHFVSMNTAWRIFLRICFYLLVVYQTCTLARKRKRISDDFS